MARVTTVPSSDLAFARAVEVVLAALPRPSAGALQESLRSIYPKVAVFERQLSGEQDVYYVYRDGTFVRDVLERWWTEPDAAWSQYSAADGRLLDASPEWMALMGGGPEDFVGRHYTEWVHPNARLAASTFHATVLELGEIHSEGLVRRADGADLRVEFYGVLIGDTIDVWYRRHPGDGLERPSGKGNAEALASSGRDDEPGARHAATNTLPQY
jgi:PAS domain-containing protein